MVVASRTVGGVKHAAKLLFSRQRTTHNVGLHDAEPLCVCVSEWERVRRGVGGRSRCAMWSQRVRCQRRWEEPHNGSTERWRGVTTAFPPNTPLAWASLQPRSQSCSTEHKRHDRHACTHTHAVRLPPTDRKTDEHNGSLQMLLLSLHVVFVEIYLLCQQFKFAKLNPICFLWPGAASRQNSFTSLSVKLQCCGKLPDIILFT